jgi:hypothetical protein
MMAGQRPLVPIPALCHADEVRGNLGSDCSLIVCPAPLSPQRVTVFPITYDWQHAVKIFAADHDR